MQSDDELSLLLKEIFVPYKLFPECPSSSEESKMSSFSSAWETPSKKSSSSNSEDEIITGIAKLWLNSAESNVCDFSLENASQNQENAAVPARELLAVNPSQQLPKPVGTPRDSSFDLPQSLDYPNYCLDQMPSFNSAKGGVGAESLFASTGFRDSNSINMSGMESYQNGYYDPSFIPQPEPLSVLEPSTVQPEVMFMEHVPIQSGPMNFMEASPVQPRPMFMEQAPIQSGSMNLMEPSPFHPGPGPMFMEQVPIQSGLMNYMEPFPVQPRPLQYVGLSPTEAVYRTRFEFPQQLLCKPLPVTMHVYSDSKVNFVNGVVSFVIQLLNCPRDFHTHHSMFDARVMTPNGEVQFCRVGSADSYILDSYYGTFRAGEDSGDYTISVSLVIPKEAQMKYYYIPEFFKGTICGSARVPISKNYALDSQRDCLRIQCKFLDVSDEFGNNEDSHGRESRACAAGFDGVRRDSCRRLLPRNRLFPNPRSKLWGLTCDLRNNNLVYSDRGSHEVTCVSPQGTTLYKFGGNKSVPERKFLSRPCGLAFDEVHNRLVVCDKDNHRICFYSLDGQYISTFGCRGYTNGCFDFPWDVAVSPTGNIVVSDSKNKRIQYFDSVGNYLTKYTVFEVNPFEFKNQFDYPRGVCFDSTGSYVYVTDFYVNNVIQIPIDFSTHKKLLPAGALLRPQGIASDSTGNLLVADSRHDCLRHMNDRGEHLATIRQITSQPLEFPINVTIMAGGFAAVLSGAGCITIF